jgi:hypothetical protein
MLRVLFRGALLDAGETGADRWVILPPRRFIQAEQWSLLNINTQEEPAGALHIESHHEIK